MHRPPRAQHVWMHFCKIADLRRLEERALGNLDLETGFRHTAVRKVYQTPECPNPPPARVVAGNSATSSHATRTTGATMSCAIRIPRDTRNVAEPRLMSGTRISPRESESIVAGGF